MSGPSRVKQHFRRSCFRCGGKISPLKRVIAIYDFSTECAHCGSCMELSPLVLFTNMLFAQLFGFLWVQLFLEHRTYSFFLVVEVWALFVFLPLITLLSYGMREQP